MRAGEAGFIETFGTKVRANQAFSDKTLFLTENVEYVEIKRSEKKNSITFLFQITFLLIKKELSDFHFKGLLY